MRKTTILAALLFLVPAMSSQAKTLEDLLVEKGIITKAEAQGAKTAAPAKVYWNKGTRVDFPDTGFSAGINTFIQTGYSFTDNDKASAKKNTSSFDVSKARIILSGTALHEEFEYMVSGDLVGSTTTNSGGGTTSNPAMVDTYVKWKACDYAALTLGQFKSNIGRSFNTDDQSLMFADRSATSNYFSLGRMGGGKLTSKLGKGVVTNLAIYNGAPQTGEGQNSSGIDTKQTIVLDLRANVLGTIDEFTESDVDYTEELGVSAGAAYAYTDGTINGVTTDMHNVTADVIAKQQGLSVAAEFFYQDFKPDQLESSSPLGAYVQAGYFLEPKKWEVALRWGYTDCDDGKAYGSCSGYNSVNQATAGINYYWWKNHLKAQLNYDHLSQDPHASGASSIDTNRWLLQLSSYF